MRKGIVAGLLVAAIATPALAQSFFIVQDTATKKCTITTERPTVSTQTIVTPSGVTYTTRAEAEAGLKTVKVCTTN